MFGFFGGFLPRDERSQHANNRSIISHFFLYVCPSDLKDMSQMILRTKGPDRLPAGYEIVLYIAMSDSDKVGVFYVESK